MKRLTGFLRTLAPLAVLAAAVSCSVHEWPEPSAREQISVSLAFDTDMPVWGQEVDGRAENETDGRVDHGSLRHIVRAYPVVGGAVQQHAAEEFVFTRNVADGYNCELTFKLVPGDYRLMVWTDLAESEGGVRYYDAADFAAIRLSGPHAANTDWRDAFRGVADMTVASYTSEHAPQSVTVAMERPLAKYEFVTTDLAAFFAKEARDDSRAATASLDEYEVVFHYTGYMPVEYNMDIDKPTDSATGVQFKSSMTRLDDDEASMGFDYVFVNGEETAVTVQVALVRKADGKQVSMTPPIRVPLRRSVHTVVRGSFLLSDASGGMGIDPGYDGDHNMSF